MSFLVSVAYRHPKLFCKRLESPTLRSERAHFIDFLRAQLVKIWPQVALRGTPSLFGKHIAHVVCMTSDPQMGGAKTAGIVARMYDFMSHWDRTNHQSICKAVYKISMALMVQPAVAIRLIKMTGPFQAEIVRWNRLKQLTQKIVTLTANSLGPHKSYFNTRVAI